jgi:hypothetical protein
LRAAVKQGFADKVFQRLDTSSLAAAFAEPSLATRKKASSERKGGNLRISSPNFAALQQKYFDLAIV